MRSTLRDYCSGPPTEFYSGVDNQAMTLAAIDRLVHHATILEMNVESYRRKAALDRKRGRPPAHATPKENAKAAD